MDINKFTEKSQAALTEAQAIPAREFLKALTEVRGNQRVTSSNPEAPGSRMLTPPSTDVAFDV
jgi:hypothetical protein